MSTRISGRIENGQFHMRFTMERGQALRLGAVHSLCVEQGTLWLAHHGEDQFLGSGDSLHAGEFDADEVISAVGNDPVQVDVVLGRTHAGDLPYSALFHPAYQPGEQQTAH